MATIFHETLKTPADEMVGEGDQRLATVLQEVAAERARQNARWGATRILRQDLRGSMTVLMEEVGELARAVLQRNSEAMRLEAVQVAAVAVAIAERFQNSENS